MMKAVSLDPQTDASSLTESDIGEFEFWKGTGFFYQRASNRIVKR